MRPDIEAMAAWLALETHFIEESWGGEEDFLFLDGNLPLLVSAPHSAAQLRQGQPKTGEYRTGPLTLALAQLTGCRGLVKTANRGDDANYDAISPYKEALVTCVQEQGIQLLLDLHLCLPQRPFDLEIGTGLGRNLRGRQDLLAPAVDLLQRHFSRVVVDRMFTASYPHTVSATLARRSGIPCFQLEINWRQVEEAAAFAATLSALAELIETLKELL